MGSKEPRAIMLIDTFTFVKMKIMIIMTTINSQSQEDDGYTLKNTFWSQLSETISRLVVYTDDL